MVTRALLAVTFLEPCVARGQPGHCCLTLNVSTEIKALWNGMSYSDLLDHKRFNKEQSGQGTHRWPRQLIN